eukprot:2212364-Prymnesium_polylepis.1
MPFTSKQGAAEGRQERSEGQEPVLSPTPTGGASPGLSHVAGRHDQESAAAVPFGMRRPGRRSICHWQEHPGAGLVPVPARII